MCKKLYMHKTTYTNYEQGKHTVPLDFAVLLADFYDVSVDYLAGRTNLPKGDRSIPDDELHIIEQFSMLTERNKGRLEQFLDDLCEQQGEDTFRQKEA